MTWTHNSFHADKGLFYDETNGIVYRNAIAMPILQIGELSKALSEETRQAHSDIPWHDVIRMRDIAAHYYESWDYDTAWNTSRDDVPALAEKVRHNLETESEETAEA